MHSQTVSAAGGTSTERQSCYLMRQFPMHFPQIQDSVIFQQLYVTSNDDDESGEQVNQTENSDGDNRNNDESNSDNVMGNSDDTVEDEPPSQTSTVEETEASAIEEAPEEKHSESSSGCIVCQCDQVTVALLPCRHTCVCRYCLLRLDKCPMCRSAIQAYFTLDGAPGARSYEPRVDTDDNPGNSPRWWVNLNQRINNFLGFT